MQVQDVHQYPLVYPVLSLRVVEFALHKDYHPDISHIGLEPNNNQ